MANNYWYAVFKRPFPKDYWEESDTVTVYFTPRDIGTVLEDAREALARQYGDRVLGKKLTILCVAPWGCCTSRIF